MPDSRLRNAKVVAAGFVVMLTAGALMIHRSRLLTHDVSDELTRQVAAEAAAEFAVFEIAPLESATNTQAILGRAAVIVGEDLHDPTKAVKLLGFVAQFLDTYYAEDGLQRYIDWRRRNGYVLTTIEEMRSNPQISRVYPYLYNGEAIPARMTAEQAFAAIWKGNRAIRSGANIPTGIASDSDGLYVRYRLLRPGDLTPPLFPPHLRMLWIGRISMTACNFWHDDYKLDEAAAQHGSVLIAHLSALIQFRDGTRRPLTWVCYWCPEREDWRFVTLLQTNVIQDGCRPPDI